MIFPIYNYFCVSIVGNCNIYTDIPRRYLMSTFIEKCNKNKVTY